MPTHQPFLTTAQGTRRFACSAVAVQAIIVNADERVLLLSSPTKNRPDEWQVISGGLEAAETVLAGVVREVREEAPTCRSGPWAWCMPRPSILTLMCRI
jgi:hypothetical protein